MNAALQQSGAVKRGLQKSHQQYVLSRYPIAIQPDVDHVNHGEEATHATADECAGAQASAAKVNDWVKKRVESSQGGGVHAPAACAPVLKRRKSVLHRNVNGDAAAEQREAQIKCLQLLPAPSCQTTTQKAAGCGEWCDRVKHHDSATPVSHRYMCILLHAVKSVVNDWHSAAANKQSDSDVVKLHQE